METTNGSRQTILKAELADALRKRERLDAVIDYLSDELGISSPSVGPLVGQVPEATAPTSGPVEWVREGQFHGKSSTAATKALLDKFGRDRPLKTQEIFEAIRKGGVSVATADGLYRSLHRDKRFYRVGRSLWGLSIWYPDGAKKLKISGGIDMVEDDESDTHEPEGDE